MLFKYVMVDGVNPVLFFSGIMHRDMERLGTITSAAMVHIIPGEDPITFGESLSLGMRAHENDALIIKRALDAGMGYGHGRDNRFRKADG